MSTTTERSLSPSAETTSGGPSRVTSITAGVSCTLYLDPSHHVAGGGLADDAGRDRDLPRELLLQAQRHVLGVDLDDVRARRKAHLLRLQPHEMIARLEVHEVQARRDPI